MGRDIDLSKPLSDEDVAWLRQRYPLDHVEHLVRQASGGEEGLADKTDEDDSDVVIEELEEAELRELSAKVSEVVDRVTDRADALGIELDEFPTVEPETTTQDDAGNGDDLYDPTKHKVEDVVDYLMTASPEETERVKAVEAAGQNRKGIADA